MKNYIFVLAFTFIGQQAFSQILIATYSGIYSGHPSNCSTGETVFTKIDPTGSVTYTCLVPERIYNNHSTLVAINQELNSIINQGYKLIYTSSVEHGGGGELTGTIDAYGHVASPTIWYFAIP